MLFCIPETNKIFKKRKRKSLPNTQIGTTVLTVFHSGLKQTKKKGISHTHTHTKKKIQKNTLLFSSLLNPTNTLSQDNHCTPICRSALCIISICHVY